MGQRIVQNHATLSFKVTYNLKGTWNSEDNFFFLVSPCGKSLAGYLCVCCFFWNHLRILSFWFFYMKITCSFFSWNIRRNIRRKKYLSSPFLLLKYQIPFITSLAPKRYFKEMPNAELILIMAVFGNIPCIFPSQKRRFLQLIHWAYHLWAPRGYFL